MEKYQSIFTSKTVWGLFAALISLVLNWVGITGISSEEIEAWGVSAFDIVTKVITVLGLCLALYGRITATRQLVVALPSQVPPVVIDPPPPIKGPKKKVPKGD